MMYRIYSKSSSYVNNRLPRNIAQPSLSGLARTVFDKEISGIWSWDYDILD